jgi:hypothetical protein
VQRLRSVGPRSRNDNEEEVSTHMTTEMTTAIEGKHGERMIEVRVRFWTDDIAKEKDKLIPKHCWNKGIVYMKNNETHGISGSSEQPIHFNSEGELQGAIDKLLEREGITRH